MLSLNNFLPHGGQANEPIPLRAAIADSCATITILYTLAQTECLAYLNRLRKEPSNYTVSELFPESRLDSSSEDSGLPGDHAADQVDSPRRRDGCPS